MKIRVGFLSGTMVLCLCLISGNRRADAATTDNVANYFPPVAGGFIQSMAVDASGNRYVGGFFATVTDFNPGVGADERVPLGVDGFVSRYNSDGSYAWTQTFSGSGTDIVEGLAVDNGVVYAVGSFNSTDARLGSQGPVSAEGGVFTDGFVIAMDAATGAPYTSFNTKGIQVISGSLDEEAHSVVVGGGVVYVGGSFSSASMMVGTSGTAFTALSGSTDGFVAALNATTGAVVPAFGVNGVQTLSGTNYDVIEALALSGAYLYVAGETDGTNATVEALGLIKSNSVGYDNVFVVRLAVANGDLDLTFNAPKSGVQVFGGSGKCVANAIRVVNSVVYVTGSFDSPNSGLNALGTISPVSGANEDAFVLAFVESTGLPVSTFGTNGIVTFGGSKDDTGTRLDVLGTTLYVVGFFSSTNAGFNGVAGTITTLGSDDAFILALDGTTGAALTTFNGKGVQTLSGSGLEVAGGVVGLGTTLIVAGLSSSPDFGVGILDDINTSVFYGFLIPLDAVAGTFTRPKPTSGGFGDNIAEGDPAVVNDLNGLSMSVTKSYAGYVELGVDITSLNASTLSRATNSASTDFSDVLGRAAVGVKGTKPAHQFLKAGVFVATSSAIEDGTGTVKGKMRKTLALSSLETGESGAVTPPDDLSINVTSMKGKFLFTKDTPDQVSFTGTVLLPAGITLGTSAGLTLSLGLGNVTDNVLLDSKGKGVLPSELGRIKSIKAKYPKLAKGTTLTVGGEKLTVQATYSLADMDTAGFDTEGITTTLASSEMGSKSVERSIQVAMVIGGVAYDTIATVTYKLSSKADSGSLSRTAK